MSPFIAYLLGYPGVGKYTVGQALASQTGAILIDNHVVNQPIFALFSWDGKNELPPEAFTWTAPIREAVFSALAEIAPRERSYVLTNVLADSPDNIAIYDRLAGVAQSRGCLFLPVMITCDGEAHRQRVRSPERHRRQKLSDVAMLEELMATKPLYFPADPNLLTIDTTGRSPEESAAAIVERLRELCREETRNVE